MKRMHKGFTLVELLVVIAIVAAMAATITMPMISGGTAKAKAATIANNVATIVSASTTYFALHSDSSDLISPDMGATDFVKAAIPSFAGFNEGANITYQAGWDGNFGIPEKLSDLSKSFVVQVSFDKDPESRDVIAELGKIAPFSHIFSGDVSLFNASAFQVFILTGEISKDVVYFQ